ncbi:murein-DD-endopeptidase [Paucimonas lemoignei]|uniref:Murein-DD-endopeptidase n=1 Tax=Paucimonas lemoignei TaxID=29443 RepID=A0A4R3HXN8_PAULE|nr:D-alanyl-D-alanine endopeptidase [Paucimonas lemoignei]TCS36965.1 murein-DD-endopeptidase [Paucimonas lemoignei]
MYSLYRHGLVALLLLLHVFCFSSHASAKAPAKPDASSSSSLKHKQRAIKKKATPNKRVTKAKPTKRQLAARSSPRKSAQRAKRVRRNSVEAVARAASGKKYVLSQNSQSLAAAKGSLLDSEASIPLTASSALVFDATTSHVLYEKNATEVVPIASITKLMTALVVLDEQQPLDEVLTVTSDDIDRIKHTSSRLAVGSKLTRANMLHIALMSSENRAASALGRHYPGGLKNFVAAMNAKAQSLGMADTHYVEPTGLSSSNVSSARDLAKLVLEAQKYPLIQQYSTNREFEVEPGGHSLQYRNSNRLIANPQWEIVLQKTGYISEAGRCMVMYTVIEERELIMVILNARGKFARAADASHIRHWLVERKLPMM